MSQQDINRANAASVTDMGDIIRRTFERNAAEINGLELSDAEKKNAVRQMATLATTALKTAAGAVNPYASGPARLRGMMKRLSPEWVIFYGKVPEECDWNIIRVKPHYDEIVKRRKANEISVSAGSP